MGTGRGKRVGLRGRDWGTGRLGYGMGWDKRVGMRQGLGDGWVLVWGGERAGLGWIRNLYLEIFV